MNIFIMEKFVTVAATAAIGIQSQSWGGAITAFIVSELLWAFLLGTYPRVNLSRDKRGKVTLTKTWRVCFIERPPQSFDVLEFQGVRTGYASDVSIMDWIIAILLLPAGIAPGIIWWYVFIQLDQHTVHLVREHGYASTRCIAA